MFHQWKWDDAERELRRAVALSPSDGTSRQWLAFSLAIRFRLVEAIAELRHALQIDPLSLAIRADLGQMLFATEQYAPALDLWNQVRRTDPTFVPVFEYLYKAHSLLRQDAEALAAFDALRTLLPGHSIYHQLPELLRAPGSGSLDALHRAIAARAAALGDHHTAAE